MTRRYRRAGSASTVALVATIGLAACGGASSDRASTADAADVTSTTSRPPDGPTVTDSSSTSSTTSSSTTTTSTLAAPPAVTTLVLTGTHAGTEHFALGTGRCPQIDHHLDETWTATNGTVLTFSNAYCGELDTRGRWSSTGTYTLGDAAGAFQGRTNNAVDKVPSPGGPYRIALDSGTGAYAGATGSCSVEEHLVMVRFGEQLHSGPFTCTITLPARANEPGASASGS